MDDVLGEIKLSLRPSPTDSMIITVINSSSASFETSAYNYSRNIRYTYNFNDSVLVINPYFKFPFNDGFHYQKSEVIIAVPVNTQVMMDEDVCFHLYDADYVDGENEGGLYLMTNNGLKLLTPEESKSL